MSLLTTTTRSGARVTLLTMVAAVTAMAEDSFNKGGKQAEYGTAVANDSSPNAAINKGVYDSGRGMSAFVWGPVMAIVLGGVVAWMIYSINKGGIAGAINAILALVLGGLAMALVYTFMIAPSA